MRKISWTTERLLAVTGLILAASAASYAGLMLTDTVRVPTFPGSEHLMIFARPATLAHGRPFYRTASAPPTSIGGVDPTPVGSLRRVFEEHPEAATGEPKLAEYSVRGIFGGKALVQTGAGFLMVEPGNDIPGAGEVSRIEWRGGEWVVVTSRGYIGQAKP